RAAPSVRPPPSRISLLAISLQSRRPLLPRVPEVLCSQGINATRVLIGEHLVSSIGRGWGATVLCGGEGGNLGYARGRCAGQAHREAFGATELLGPDVHRGDGRKAPSRSGALRASVVVGRA